MKRILKRLLACALAIAMIFQCLPDKGTVSEAATDTISKPVIGKQVNLAHSAVKLISSFDTDTTKVQYLDLGAAEIKGDTWYFSGTFSYEQLTSAYAGGLNFIFGEGMYNSESKELAITARPNVQGGNVIDTQLVVWAGVDSDALYVSGTSDVKYGTGVDYTYTVKYSKKKVSLWIDDNLMINEFDLSTKSVTDINPKFGFNADGTKGTISDIKIWDNVQTNLALDAFGSLPTKFNTGDERQQYINLGNVSPAKGHEDNYTYYFSGKFSYTNQPVGVYSGLAFKVGDITYGSSQTGELTVTARRNIDSDGNVESTNYLVGTDVGNGYFYQRWLSDKLYTTNTEYRWTVKVTSTGQVELWIDDVNWTQKVTNSGYYTTDHTANSTSAGNFGYNGASALIAPKFGLQAEAAEGTLSDIQIWGELEGAQTMDTDDTNLAEGRTMPTFFTAVTTQTLDLGKIQPTSDTPNWCYSGTFQYSDVGNYKGLTPIFAEGTYNGQRVELSVVERPVDNGAQIVVWAGSTALTASGSSRTYSKDKVYVYTIVFNDGKLSYWMNNTLVVDDFDLRGAGVTDITPKFGLKPDGSSGSISEIKVWGDLERVNPATKPESVANLTEEAGEIVEFKAGTNQYYNNEKINISGDSWYYSGIFEYSSIPTWGGITLVFGEGEYNYTLSEESAAYRAPVVGTRELSVTARAAGGDVQKVLWADTLAVHAGSVSGLALETGKEYKWTIEVEDGLLTFWINDTLVYDELNLASYGITNVMPRFGIKPDGSSGAIKNVQIWDASTVAAMPVFATTDTNESLYEELNVTAATDRLQFEGITYHGSYSYSADIEGDARLVLGNGAEGSVEVYYKDGKAYLVEHVSDSDKEIASKEIAIDVSNGCSYLVKNDNGAISLWVNDTLVLNKIAVANLTSDVGVAGEGTGVVSNILLWGDIARETQAILYQKFEDISSYRGTEKTYPQAIGYVFGGWYTSANEDSPVSTSTTSGEAYAKFVPEDVLRVMAQTNADTTYSSTSPTRLRLVTTVDSQRYSEISFDVTFKGVKKELYDVYVYNTIKVSENEKEFKYAPTYFHEQSSHFYTYSITNISSAIFDEPFTVVPRWTTLDGTDVSGVARDIAINDNNNKRWTVQKLGENGLGGSKLLQLATEKDATQMMSYVIEAYNPDKASEPYVIVIDGGEAKDAAYLSWLLTTKYDGHVDAWFITHEHSDHYGALLKMLEDGQIGDKITIDKLYYNFPDNITHGQGTQNFMNAVSNNIYLNGKVSEQVMGMTYNYGRVNIKVLSDCDEYYGVLYKDNAAGDQNNASIIMLAEFDDGNASTENTEVLFLGDMGRAGEAYVMKQINACGVDLTGVAVQMAHHGNSGVSKAFYDMLDPIACLWPCTNWLWENMPQGTEEPGTGSWENVELHQYLLNQGVTEHYTAAYGNYEFN